MLCVHAGTEEEAHNLQKLHLWMKHACLRPRVVGVPDSNPATAPAADVATGVPVVDADTTAEKPTLLTPTCDLSSQGINKKLHECHASDDRSVDALRQVDASAAAPHGGIPGSQGGSLAASGAVNTASRTSSKKGKNAPMCFWCCFAPPAAADDTETHLLVDAPE